MVRLVPLLRGHNERERWHGTLSRVRCGILPGGNQGPCDGSRGRRRGCVRPHGHGRGDSNHAADLEVPAVAGSDESSCSPLRMRSSGQPPWTMRPTLRRSEGDLMKIEIMLTEKELRSMVVERLRTELGEAASKLDDGDIEIEVK